MVLASAGWRGASALAVPPNVTLVPVPRWSPRCNPMERAWLSLRERFLSLCVLGRYDAIVDACCIAWPAIAEDTDCIRSFCLSLRSENLIGHARRYEGAA